MQLKQLIPEEFCLRCDVCCRFPQAHTKWAPLFTESEIKDLINEDILSSLLFTPLEKTIDKVDKGMSHCDSMLPSAQTDRKRSSLTEFTDHPKDKKVNYSIDAKRINLIEYKDYFICPCFNPPDCKCRIYIKRPFECQLYPFLLTRQGDKPHLSQHNKCPYLNEVKEDRLNKHIDYLRTEFKKEENINFLKQNPELFTEYPAMDLKLLFSINI